MRRLAREHGADRDLAAAILAGLRTGWVPFKHVEVGTGKEKDGLQVRDLTDWLQLLAYAFPREKEAPEALTAEEIRGMSTSQLVELAKASGLE